MTKRQRRTATWKGQQCEYCLRPAETCDHFMPTRFGGPDVDENWVAACLHCNHQKNSLTPGEWFAVLRHRGWVP